MRKLILSGILLLSLIVTNSQNIEIKSPLQESVEAIKSEQIQLKQFDLFSEKKQILRSDPPYKQFLKDSKLITLNQVQLKILLSESPKAITVSIPGIGTEDLLLELVKVNLFKEGFQVVTDDDQPVDFDLGIHYQGIISGIENSIAALSVFENEVMGLFSARGLGNVVLGKLTESEDFILYAEHNLDRQRDFICATPDDNHIYSEQELTRGLETRASGDPVGIYIEADRDVYQANGSNVNATSQWLAAIFGEAAAVYAAIGVTIQISDIKIWTNKIQHRGSTSSTFLSSFQKKNKNWSGDLAILVNLVNAGGIAAGFSGLCNTNRTASMCYAGIDASFSLVPTYSWTVDVFCHELGHLFGSRHTHACVWNNNGTPIDGCYTIEGFCAQPPIPIDKGTTMSYCHLSGRPGKLMEFHEQPAAVLLNNVASASCLGGASDHCTNGFQDGDEEGVDCGGTDCIPCNPGSCDIPIPTQTNNVRRNRARVNWTTVAGAVSYTLQKRAIGASSWDTYSTSGTNYNLSGLNTGTTYEWQVQANCGSSTSGFSASCTFLAGGAKTQSCGSNSLIVDNQVTIYPNPVSQEITIDFGKFNSHHGEMILLDELGRLVLRQQIKANNNNMQVDVSNLNTGLYFMKIAVEQEISMHKVMVRR